MRRILRVIFLTLILSLSIGATVLAVGTITNFVAKPTDTTVTLTWTKSISSDITRVRFLTTAYPTDPTGAADGSTSIYFSTGNTVVHSSLTSGTTYYYTAWAYDGAYGAVVNTVVTTLAVASTGDTFPTPTMPVDQKIDSSTWYNNLQPITGIIAYFASDWGMPTNNMMYTFGAGILLLVGVGLYLISKSPLLAIGGDFIINFGLVAIHLAPAWSFGVIIAIGLGIWALEWFSSR